MRFWLVAPLIAGATPLAAEMTYLDSFHWVIERDYFGGLSGIELSDDGLSFTVISDSGFIGTGRLTREDGLITAARHDPFYMLEEPLVWPGSDEVTQDSEGLAVTDGGTVFVSYEGIAVVREERGRDVSPVVLPVAPAFAGLQSNGSLEALAVDAQGDLYAIPERSGRAMRPFPVFRFDGTGWDVAFEVPRLGAFLPTGADIGPDGMLYLLERDFNGWGFSTRVRRFGLDGSGGETLLETAPGVHDNLEGIAVWADDVGLRISMVSDNNYRRSQRTEIVEYRLTE